MITALPIASGYFSQAPVTGGAPPDPPPSQLGVPSLIAGLPVDGLTTRTVVVSVSGPSSWPVGVQVQLQTQRAPGAFADLVLTAVGTTLVLERESTAYTINVRGFATNGGAIADSEVSGVLAITVPALDAPPIAVLAAATPLQCRVQLFPSTSQPVDATGGGGIPTLNARTATDHVLRITQLVAELTGATVEPTDIRYVVSDATGTLVAATVAAPVSPDVWQIAFSRALFTPTRGPLALTLTLVAPDATETALQFTLAQGVQQ